MARVRLKTVVCVRVMLYNMSRDAGDTLLRCSRGLNRRAVLSPLRLVKDKEGGLESSGVPGLLF